MLPKECTVSKKSIGGFQQTGKKEGGWGEGIFVRLLRAVGAVGWEQPRSLAKWAAKQKAFSSLLEKMSSARLKNMEKIFALRRRAAAGGAAGWDGLGFCSSLANVWVIMVEGSNFFQDRPPKLISRFASAAGKARAIGFGWRFPEVNPGFLKFDGQLPRRDAAVFNEILKLSVRAESR